MFWRKNTIKAKAQRAEFLKKAHDLAANPQKYTKVTSYGAAKYVNNLKFDKKTGEIFSVKERPVFDDAKVAEEEKYDGYYAIVTSELEMTDSEVIDTYRGLWKIEKTFRVTKGVLETRPVYASLKDHINAHFLLCFISFTIMRIIQHPKNIILLFCCCRMVKVSIKKSSPAAFTTSPPGKTGQVKGARFERTRPRQS